MATQEALAQMRAMAAQLHAAKSLQDLDRLYVEWIGYSIVEDDPLALFDEVNDILQGYLREVCDSVGVPYIDAVTDGQETVARWGSDELVTIRPASVLWRD